MLEMFEKPVGFFLIIMAIILITPLLSERVRLPGIVGVPGFGSRKRVADTLGNLHEQLAEAFDGNLAILHFDE